MAETEGVTSITETSPVDQTQEIAPPAEEAAPPADTAENVEEIKERQEELEAERNGDATEVIPVEAEEAGVEDQDSKRKVLEGSSNGEESEAKRQKVDSEEADGLDKSEVQESHEEQAPLMENGNHSTEENLQQTGEDDAPKQTEQEFQYDEIAPDESQYTDPNMTTSREIEVPTKRVGILIGKSGDTIRNLQFNSGAKIQIVKDADADPNSTTRAVELIGTIACINKAERLIKDVLAEADAGGSPALVAKGFVMGQSGSDQVEIQVPNEKVGVIIGKGGQMIKDLQSRSGARIQLVPQQASEGEDAKERGVRINGNRQQIEAAKSMIREVISQSGRPQSHHRGSGPGNRQSHGSRGPSSGNQWGPPRSQQNYNNSYNQQQRGGNYRSTPQNYPQYPQQSYGNYPPSRGGSGSSMGPTWDQRSALMGGPGPYGQQHQQQVPQGYGPNNAYQAPPQQMYQAPTPQQYYGQQNQTGVTTGFQSGYQQQPFNNTMYQQGQASGVPAQQQYPYGPGAQSYGAQAGADGYAQQYPQQYTQQTSQSGAGYGQAGQMGPMYTQGNMNWMGDQSAGYNNQAMGGMSQMGYGQAGQMGQMPVGQVGFTPQLGVNVNQGAGFDQGAMMQPAAQGQVQPGGVQPVGGQWQG